MFNKTDFEGMEKQAKETLAKIQIRDIKPDEAILQISSHEISSTREYRCFAVTNYGRIFKYNSASGYWEQLMGLDALLMKGNQ